MPAAIGSRVVLAGITSRLAAVGGRVVASEREQRQRDDKT
jgi:hypothetical protein